jgi:hypothetical protein
MITWAIAWMAVHEVFDNGFHLLFAMLADIAIICGTTAIICGAIKKKMG